MYKKHELMTVLIFRNNIFRHIGTNLSKNTYSKKKKKMAESPRSISPIKKKAKHSKLFQTKHSH